jgi:hypothetical protein
MKRETAWIRVLRPPLVAVQFILGTVYTDLLGRWLDLYRHRKLDAALVKDIDHRLKFLFTQRNARILPSDEHQVKRVFGLALVTVATDDLHIRFITVHSHFTVEVGSTRLPHRWEDLSSALENAELSEGAGLNAVVAARRSHSYSFYMDVERLLRSHWSLLRRYCHKSC